MAITVIISSLCALVVTMINAGVFNRIAKIEEQLMGFTISQEKRLVSLELLIKEQKRASNLYGQNPK